MSTLYLPVVRERLAAFHHTRHKKLTCFQINKQEGFFSVINIQRVAASLAAFIVREGARTLVRSEAFDFLLIGFKTRRHTAAVMASICT